jgi:hypothetical protein
MRIIERINNIECAIDSNFISQAGAGIDPRDARAAAKTVVEDGCFDAAELCGVAILSVHANFFCPAVIRCPFVLRLSCRLITTATLRLGRDTRLFSFYTEISLKTQTKSVVDTSILKSYHTGLFHSQIFRRSGVQ